MRRARTVLRYHGGKWQLAPWIVAHFPPHRIYTEAYGGAASVLLYKQRSYAEVYNDLDGEVVNVFRVLRDHKAADELRHLLSLTPYCRKEFEEAYTPASNPIEQARRTIIKSHMGFGADGITASWRTGFRGTATTNNVPARDWADFYQLIPVFSERLRGVVVDSRDALTVLRENDSPETLHYADPPYPHGTRYGGTKHSYRHEMTDDDHRALAATLRSLRGMVVLSGYPCPLYDTELYSDWQRVTRSAYADGAAKRTEVLWMNACASRHMQARLFTEDGNTL